MPSSAQRHLQTIGYLYPLHLEICPLLLSQALQMAAVGRSEFLRLNDLGGGFAHDFEIPCAQF